METALIIYQSIKGTTRRLGNEIGRLLSERGIQSQTLSIEECQNGELYSADYLFLGCWTQGWMVVNQHPDSPWKKWAQSIEIPRGPKVALFTTYKLATGSMFQRMRRHLNGSGPGARLEIKSRDGRLSDAQARQIHQFIAR
jgi:flavodoxin